MEKKQRHKIYNSGKLKIMFKKTFSSYQTKGYKETNSIKKGKKKNFAYLSVKTFTKT